MFDTLQKRLGSAMKKVRGVTRISEADIDGVLSEIRTGLLEADVHFRVVKDFLARVRERCLRAEVMGSLTPEQQILKVLSDELTQILGGKNRDLNLAVKAPAVVLMCGLQGSGKTTTTIKLAMHLKTQGRRPVVVSVDVSRPAAMQQLASLGERNGVSVIPAQPTQKPIDIAKFALKEAENLNADTLLVDTAGRLQIDDALMDELASLKDFLQPAEILLVCDAMMGQQAVEVAEGFDRRIGVTGAVLTKLDGDARGGAALSLVTVTGKPIKFIGTGERATDFEPFHPERVSSRLLDMGDVLTLLERASKVITEDEAMAAADKVKKPGELTLQDFRDQLAMLAKMGPLSGLLKMIPGFGAMREQLEKVDAEKELKRINAILDSMTPTERKQPESLTGSHRARIARGSGTEVQEVNQLVKRFLDARKMMKQFSKVSGLMGGAGGKAGASPFGRASNPKGFGRKL